MSDNRCSSCNVPITEWKRWGMRGEVCEDCETICGAGHRCCDVAMGPPYHDHFLSPDACPKCEPN